MRMQNLSTSPSQLSLFVTQSGIIWMEIVLIFAALVYALVQLYAKIIIRNSVSMTKLEIVYEIL